MSEDHILGPLRASRCEEGWQIASPCEDEGGKTSGLVKMRLRKLRAL